MSRKPSPAKKPPAAPAPVPTLPQHNLPPPYDELLVIGDDEDDETYERLAGQLRKSNVTAAVEKLVAIALDESYFDYADRYEDFEDALAADARVWVPIHAIHVLERFGAEAAPYAGRLVTLLDSDVDDVVDEAPFLFAAIGPSAIPVLLSAALTPEKDDESIRRISAIESLAAIAETHPGERDSVISSFVTMLGADTDEWTNGSLVLALMDLGAQETIPEIERAMAEGRVALDMVRMADVQLHFGLPVTDIDATDGDEDEETLEVKDATTGAESPVEPREPFVGEERPGRNDPCSCGSGKKYKKCCGA